MRLLWLLLPLITLAILPFAVANFGEDGLAGGARIIAGDKLVIDGRRIHLHGVRAPGLHRNCSESGEPWYCGRDSMVQLSRIIDRHRVTCAPVNGDGKGRIEAICSVGEINLNRAIIQAGWAFASPNAIEPYKLDEASARLTGKGIWRGEGDRFRK